MFNIINQLKKAIRKANELRQQRKIKFLQIHIYNDFLNQITKKEYFSKSGEVDIPEFLKVARRKNYAQVETDKTIKKIVEENRVDECYKNCKKFLRRNKRRGN